jgi:formylglycine-generating enzyme required for sulfatase activity
MMVDPIGITGIAEKAVDTISLLFTGKKLDTLLAKHGSRMAFARGLARSLEAMRDAGLGVGPGGIDESFLCLQLVVDHLWKRILVPGEQGEIDYDLLIEELRTVWEPEIPLGANVRVALEFLVDRIYDYCWQDDALRPIRESSVLKAMDERVSAFETRWIVRRYTESTLQEKVFDRMVEDMGEGVEYVVPELATPGSDQEDPVRRVERPTGRGDPRERLVEGSDHRVVVVAGSGVGKTLLLQQTARWIQEQDDLRIPIYLPPAVACGCCNRDGVTSALVGLFEPSGVRENKLRRFVHKMRQEGRFVFLIDALDQMGDLAGLLSGLETNAFGTCRIVLTSRPETWQRVDESLEEYGFVEMELQEFGQEQIESYLGDLGLEALPPGVDEKFLRVPVLLKMVRRLILDRVGLARVRTRAQLYGQFIHHLIDREARRLEVKVNVVRRALPYLRQLAYQSMVDGYAGRPYPIERADEIVGEERVEELLCRDFVRFIAEVEPAIDFRHRSFQEYLAGQELGRRWNAGEVALDGFLPSDEWHEPVRLMLGEMERERVEKALELIEPIDHPFALSCLPDAAWLDTEQTELLLSDGVEREDADGAELRARGLRHLRGRFSEKSDQDINYTLKVLGSYIRETAHIKGDNCQPLWIAVSMLGQIIEEQPDLKTSVDQKLSPLLLKSSDKAYSHFYDKRGQPLRMCQVLAGPFFLGHTAEELERIKEKLEYSWEDELFGQQVDLPGFTIDQFPVTNAEYELFDPGHQRCDRSDRDDQPAVEVSWYEASLFAFWVGKRLPTEVEWEKTCRGPAMVDGRENRRIFPWGDEWDLERCCSASNSGGRTAPVGKFDNRNLYGCHDMSGNVDEWCSSLLRPYPYWCDLAEDPLSDDDRVVRGGSWYDRSPDVFRCSFRINDVPDVRGVSLGFRCVQDF